jgi:hypothetical protein
MEDAEPSDDVEMVVNVVMSFLLIGGALLLRELVRLVDFGVRRLAYTLVSTSCVHRGKTGQRGLRFVARGDPILHTPTLHRTLSRTPPWRT